jgi:putative transcriptional regulator
VASVNRRSLLVGVAFIGAAILLDAQSNMAVRDEGGQNYLRARRRPPTMAREATSEDSVLRSKRNATRYQILVEIAERQPAVNQQEIADAIGVTAQAVSDYLQDLLEQGYVEKHGRGRYEVTKEGIDWLISQTDALRSFVEHVSEDVIGQVDIEAALTIEEISEGQTVSLSMRGGVLRAAAGDVESTATAVAVTDAERGREVGVTDFEGVLDYELGRVTLLSIPQVQEGGSAAVDPDRVAARATEHDLLAVDGTEALAAATAAGLEPDIRFGAPLGVREAAMKGQSVLAIAVADELSRITDKLREQNLNYEVVEAADE